MSRLIRFILITSVATAFIAASCNKPTEKAPGAPNDEAPTITDTRTPPSDLPIPEQIDWLLQKNPAYAAHPGLFEDLTGTNLDSVADFKKVLQTSTPEEAIALLGHPAWAVRVAAVDVLKGRAEDATPALTEAMETGTPRIRLEIMKAGFPTDPGERDKFATLNEILPDQNQAVFFDDRFVFGLVDLEPDEIGSSPIDPVRFCIRLIECGDISDQAFAAKTLARFGPVAKDAVPTLIALLESKDYVDPIDGTVRYDHRTNVAVALGSIGPDAVDAADALREIVDNKGANPILRYNAAAALYSIGQDRERVLQLLISALDTESGEALAEVVSILGRIGPDARDALPRLIILAGDENADVRSAVMYALNDIGGSNEFVIDAAISNLGSTKPEIRSHAIFVLDLLDSGTFGEADLTKALPALYETLNDSNWEMRLAAAQTIIKIRGPNERVIPVLVGLVDVQKSYAAAEELGKIGPDASDAIPSLLNLLETDNRENMLIAARAILAVGGTMNQVVRRLIDLTGHSSRGVRIAAIIQLGEIGPDAAEALPTLRELAESDIGEIKLAALVAISQIEQQDTSSGSTE